MFLKSISIIENSRKTNEWTTYNFIVKNKKVYYGLAYQKKAQWPLYQSINKKKENELSMHAPPPPTPLTEHRLL